MDFVMKQKYNPVLLAFGLIMLCASSACIKNNANVITDQNFSIADQNWQYNNLVKNGFDITDAAQPYNLYLNLRITPDYKYANLFVLVHLTAPNKKTTTTRYEFTVANPDGEWLGQGAGNLYSYQLLFKHHFKFATKGHYQISVEQNMRDNPLREVSDVGLRVEKAE